MFMDLLHIALEMQLAGESNTFKGLCEWCCCIYICHDKTDFKVSIYNFYLKTNYWWFHHICQLICLGLFPPNTAKANLLSSTRRFFPFKGKRLCQFGALNVSFRAMRGSAPWHLDLCVPMLYSILVPTIHSLCICLSLDCPPVYTYSGR